MKKTITLLSLFLVAALAQAVHPRASKLVINLNGMQNVDVTVSGIHFENVSNKLVVPNLRPGPQRVRISRNHYSRGRHAGTTVMVRGQVHLPASSRVITSVGRRGYLRVVEVKPLRNQGSNYRDGYRGGRHNRINAFDRLILDLERARFEQDKFDMARRYVLNNQVYASDVHDIMKTLRFEQDRLKIAKIAYRNTINKRDYREVRQALRYGSSRQQLQDFIYRFNRRR